MALARALAALSGWGTATAYVIPWAMVPDIIECDELETGRRRDGFYYAFALPEAGYRRDHLGHGAAAGAHGLCHA